MRNILIALFIITSNIAFSQIRGATFADSLSTRNVVVSNQNNSLSIGAYGEINYNQIFGGDLRQNGELDVQRMVLSVGYRFKSKTSFFTEIEFEHVSEVFIEQAFLNHRFNKHLNFKAGLLLIPMGIINEYHEPTTFNGVERPSIDGKVVPTTWREIGAGFTGRFDEASLKYQVYLVNGFNGYNGAGVFRGSDGLRKGRQKGAQSFISHANVSAKLDYYGVRSLKLGLAGYFGKSQSTLFDGLDETDKFAMATADSSQIDIAMIGFDARYNRRGLELRGQYILANLGNTDQYNSFTGKDIGSVLQGYYVEAGYNLFRFIEGKTDQLVPFVRYENYNTHQSTDGGLEKNDAYNVSEVTAGIGWRIGTGAVLKADIQFKKTAAADKAQKQLNMGVGIWF